MESPVPIVRQDERSVFSKLRYKENGIYFFYFPECPWCKEIMPILKTEANYKHVPINITNIHAKKYSKKEKNSLKQIIQKSNHIDSIIVPFFVVIDNHKVTKAQIGVIRPAIKRNRLERIKKEIDHLLASVPTA